MGRKRCGGLIYIRQRSRCGTDRRMARTSVSRREPGRDQECSQRQRGFAVCLKEDGKAIGAIELKLNGHTDMTDRDDECEMGYWLGKPFWGRGIMPEAVKEMLRHAFEDCGMRKVWIGYYEGNIKSKRVQEKCGFKYQWKTQDVDVPLMHEKRTGNVSLMTREDWLSGK